MGSLKECSGFCTSLWSKTVVSIISSVKETHINVLTVEIYGTRLWN